MKKRFTLIELIIVIAILGILAAIVIPNIRDIQGKATISAIQSDARNIQTSVDMYALDNNGKYPTNDQPTEFIPQPIDFNKLYPKYLRQLPKNIDIINYWVDFKGKVWVSTIDSPTNIQIEDGKLTWDAVEGASFYNVYELEGYSVSNSPVKNFSLKFLDKTENTEILNISEEKAYLVNAVDFKGFESSPVGYGYQGYVRPAIPDNPANPNPNENEEPYQPVVQKPTAVISMNPENNLYTYTTISFNSSNSTSQSGAIVAEEWQVDNEEIVNTPPNGKFSAGNHIVKLRVKDEAGNWSDWASKSFAVQNNYAMKFDGIDDYIDNMILPDMTEYTFEALITWDGYIEGLTEERTYPDGTVVVVEREFVNTIVGGKERTSPISCFGLLEIRDNYAASYRHPSDATLVSDYLFPIGEKVHFAMTQSADKQTIYINGVKVAEEEGNIPYENAKFVIGKGYITRFFHGKMDYVRAWNVARTEQQIMEYKDIEIHEAQEGLIGSWNFNEGSGTTVYDESGNGHHGTVYGATWELSN